MDNEEKSKIYNKGVIEGKKHSTSAPDTLRRLNYVEKHMVTKDLFGTKIDDLKEFFNEKFKTNNEAHKKLLQQQTITNGSVKSLKAWRFALAMSWTVVTIMFPVMFYYYTVANEFQTKDTIRQMIESNNTVIRLDIAEEVEDYLEDNVEEVYYNN